MFAPADRDFGRPSAGYRVDPGSPQLAALVGALTGLTVITDEVTAAVQHHDRAGLERSNARAEELLAEVDRISSSLTEDERALIGETEVAALCERLAAGARRNAYLIEQAWAVDAALMRLVVGVGKEGAYATEPAPTYMDRQA
jgi:hypothetical protein